MGVYAVQLESQIKLGNIMCSEAVTLLLCRFWSSAVSSEPSAGEEAPDASVSHHVWEIVGA